MKNDTHDNDIITIDRPDGMDTPTWKKVRAELHLQIDDLISRAQAELVACPEHSWCEQWKYPGEHEEFHAGGIVELAGCDRDDIGKEGGWWCWLVENRDGGKPGVVFEGILDGKASSMQVDAIDVVRIMLATGTKEARTALLDLLEQVKS